MVTNLEKQLKFDLRQALRAREITAVMVLRTAVAAIDNAGSVTPSETELSPKVGKSADVPRRELTEQDILSILRQELFDLDSGIAATEEYGNGERTRELQAQRAVLAKYIDP